MKQLSIYIFFLILASGLSSKLNAQDLTGIWRGHFASNNNRILQLLGEEDKYKFEVQLGQTSKQFTGVTYSYKTTVFYGKASCSGTINPATKKVYLEELKIVEVRMAGGDACIMTCFLQYSKVGAEEFLEGSYTSMNIRDSTNCGKGTIFLRKVPTSDFYKEPFLIAKEKENATRKSPPVTKKTPAPATKTPPSSAAKKPAPGNTKPATKQPGTKPPVASKETPPVTPRKVEQPKVVTVDSNRNKAKKPSVPMVLPRVLTTRKNELIKTIYSDSRTISIKIYDNGTVDNDTISVYLDKKLIINKERLTEQAITYTFELDEDGEEHELIMVAENLGEIPPNTSLMVVRAGSKQEEVRITSNEQKNAVILFRYRNQ